MVHHRAGPLKQQNKKHKTGKHVTKAIRERKCGGRVESSTKKAHAQSNNTMQANSKQMRLLRQKQLRQHKKENLLLDRRCGTSSPLSASSIGS